MEVLRDSENNLYGFCVNCGGGIEINRRRDGQIHAEFYTDKFCFYCEHNKPRTIAQLKYGLDEAKTILSTARRINNAVAIMFYERQTAFYSSALSNYNASAPAQVNPPTQAQQSLFDSLLK